MATIAVRGSSDGSNRRAAERDCCVSAQGTRAGHRREHVQVPFISRVAVTHLYRGHDGLPGGRTLAPRACRMRR